MRDEDLPESSNIEDRRGEGGGFGGGGGMGFPMGGGLGIGTVVVLGLLGWALGIDPRLLIGGAEQLNNMRQGAQTSATQTGTPSDDMGQFVAAVLAANETVGAEVLPREEGIP